MADEEITLPLVDGFAYDFTINWGDGSLVAQVTAFDDIDATHVFAVPEDYTVTLTGIAEAWSTRSDHPDRLNLIAVPSLGNMGWRSLGMAFQGCENLTMIAGGDTSQVLDMSLMFAEASRANPDTSTWNTQNVISMNGMFYRASSANPGTGAWSTANVVDMNGMFYGASSANPNTSGWDTANVTDMRDMFREATSANPDMSGWDFSSLSTSSTATQLMLAGSAVRNLNYSNLLVRLAATAIPAARFLSAPAEYQLLAAAARDQLVADGWTIDDEGPE